MRLQTLACNEKQRITFSGVLSSSINHDQPEGGQLTLDKLCENPAHISASKPSFAGKEGESVSSHGAPGRFFEAKAVKTFQI